MAVDSNKQTNFNIYIPIWLDLLLFQMIYWIILITDLHSNMVRFIIPAQAQVMSAGNSFTFQYG